MKIFVYNPESDYALADFSPTYNPPAKVLKIRRKGAFCQLALAEPGDAVLLLDPIDEIISEIGVEACNSALKRAEEKGVRILTLAELPAFTIKAFESKVIESGEQLQFSPWGWNPAIKQMLKRHLKPAFSRYPEAEDNLLPSDDYIGIIRKLSHRRITIPFNELLNKNLRSAGLGIAYISPIPLEFNDCQNNCVETMAWEAENHPAFFKAPWSSSGRGILFTENMEPTKIRQWISGIMRRQGSVMAETAAAKVLDFATEWKISSEPTDPSDSSDMPDSSDPSEQSDPSDSTTTAEKVRAEFLSLSVFEASKNGKYKRNIEGDYSELLRIIQRHLPDFDERVIVAQKKTIEHFCGGYNGFLGIDMLATEEGEMRGAIELNFRTTMGVIAYYRNEDT